jgi:hypothetical protein
LGEHPHVLHQNNRRSCDVGTSDTNILRGERHAEVSTSFAAAVATGFGRELVSVLAGNSESREGAERSLPVTCKRGLLTSVKYAGDDTQIHKSQFVRDKLLK